jgi:hypothetical protein
MQKSGSAYFRTGRGDAGGSNPGKSGGPNRRKLGGTYLRKLGGSNGRKSCRGSTTGSEQRLRQALKVFNGLELDHPVLPGSAITVKQFVKEIVSTRSRVLHGTMSVLTDETNEVSEASVLLPRDHALNTPWRWIVTWPIRMPKMTLRASSPGWKSKEPGSGLTRHPLQRATQVADL